MKYFCIHFNTGISNNSAPSIHYRY